jgi:hypothetical protein
MIERSKLQPALEVTIRIAPGKRCSPIILPLLGHEIPGHWTTFPVLILWNQHSYGGVQRVP